MEEKPFKAGFAAIVGKPNAGKSTLLNRLLQFKLSIVSSKPQTTRNNVLGILNAPGYQVCLLDTPGLIWQPKDKLQLALSHNATNAARRDADVVLLLAEPGPITEDELPPLLSLRQEGIPLIVAINKIDAAPAPSVAKALADFQEALKPDALFAISAQSGEGVGKMLEAVVQRLPESPALYETDQMSDRWERFFVAEIIREKIFDQFQQEIPHACAVVIEGFVEAEGHKDHITATIYVEKDSQKGIVVGQAGRKIKDLGLSARVAIEKFLGRDVFLELRVAVKENWRRDPKAVKELGYTG